MGAEVSREPVLILLVSGSTRSGSTNSAALRTAEVVAPPDLAPARYEGLADLPAFNPDDDGDRLPQTVANLRRLLAKANAVLFCTPEYAGSLPGSFKNLLDWTVGGGQLYGKPVAWINVSAPGRGELAHASLATVLSYVGATVIQPACVRIPVPRDTVGSDGTVSDPTIRAAILDVLTAIGQHVRPS